jgi:hypothetical protein
MLRRENFLILPFMGINLNVKREWRTLHRAFGGIGIFDLAVKHTIGMINIFIQHYGAGTTVALKYSALLEALQLEIGCTGNPLEEDYEKYHWLATDSQVKSFWEHLHYYWFCVHLEYTCLPLPRQNDASLGWMCWQAGYRTHRLQALNRCQLAHQLIFLSDMALACGRHIGLFLLAPPKPGAAKWRSSYIFPNCRPSQVDWTLWLKFWTVTTGNAGLLHIPLGKWTNPSHRTWQWFYCKYSDTLFYNDGESNTAFVHTAARARVQSIEEYHQGEDIDTIPSHCVPAHVLSSPDGTILRRGTGPPLATTAVQHKTFWEYLRSLEGDWMWENIHKGDIDVMD